MVVTGAAVPLLAGVMQSTNAGRSDRETGMGQFALSASAMLLYAAGDRYPTGTSTLVRVDRKGAETTLAEMTGRLANLRFSPSGSRVVAFKTADGSRASDIWTYDLPSGAISMRVSCSSGPREKVGAAFWVTVRSARRTSSELPTAPRRRRATATLSSPWPSTCATSSARLSQRARRYRYQNR